MAKKLTDRFLKVVEPPSEGRLEIADAEAPGLVFRLTSNGARSWAMRYRPRGLVQRRETIGPYPMVKLAEARQRAKEIAAAAGRGIDLPAQERTQGEEQRKTAKRAITVADLLHRYVAEYCEPNQRRPEAVRRIFENHVIPKLGNKALGELRRAELVELLDDLQNKKKLRAQTNRTRSQMLAALNWAVERELMEYNPVATIKRRKIETPRERVLSRDELVAVWRAAGKLPEPGQAFVKVLILTGQRRDEVRGMEWDEIKDGVWTLPAARNKGKRDHDVPLAPAVAELLEKLPRLGPFVFTRRGKKRYAGHNEAKKFLDRESGVGNWKWHDLRRTCRSGLAELRIPEEVAERVLGHQQQGLVKTYNIHQYREEKRAALCAWADRVAFLVGEGRAAPNVVELVRAGA